MRKSVVIGSLNKICKFFTIKVSITEAQKIINVEWFIKHIYEIIYCNVLLSQWKNSRLYAFVNYSKNLLFSSSNKL